mmetsp:Transcript_7371/g.11033  ORF Transcript_7371/g.11033 Transcript_7371/m.11033 type:complete len:1093 (-) Transcript_7371:182-3460(-)
MGGRDGRPLKRRRETPAQGSDETVLRSVKRFFPSAWTLRDYAATNWPDAGLHSENGLLADPQKRISGMLVSFHDRNPLKPPDVQPGTMTRNLQAEIVDKALSRLFERQKRPQNVLCSGFYSDTTNGISGPLNGISLRAPSTAVAIVKSPDFGLLLEVIGRQAMMFLLMNSCLHVPLTPSEHDLPSGGEDTVRPDSTAAKVSFFQITGEPPGDLPSKRNRGGAKVARTSPTIVNKLPLLYKGDLKYCERGGFRGIFPSRHPLGRGRRGSKRNALKLFTQIFGLRNERHLRSTKKLRRRLEPLVTLLKQVLDRSAEKDLSYILHKHCPIPPNLLRADESEATEGEESSARYQSGDAFPDTDDATGDTQDREGDHLYGGSPEAISLSSSTTASRNAGRSSTRKPQYRRNVLLRTDLDVPSLIRATTSSQSVGKFLFSACTSVLPKELLGCSGNWVELRRTISIFVNLRKYDSLDVVPLVNRMRVSQVPWLSISDARSGVCSHDDLVWRKDMLRRVFCWIFRGFLSTLLKTVFYCSDRESTGMKITYYRRPIWSHIRFLSTQTLLSNKFREIDHRTKDHIRLERLERGLYFSYSKLRWIPKENGVRALQVSLMDDVDRGSKYAYYSSRSLWRNVGAILRHEIRSLGGSNVGTRAEIYRRYLLFSDEWRRAGKPRMFAAKFDVVSSFDTILSKRLVLDVLPRLIKGSDYLVLRYRKFHWISRRKGVRWARKVIVSENQEESSFLRLARNKICEQGRSSVLVDDVSVLHISRVDVLQALSHVILKNLVEVNGKFHLQSTGIPQGMPLSSMLAVMYYADLERSTELADYARISSPSINLRFVDDFFLATASQEAFTGYTKLMTAGFSEYGTAMSQRKSILNYGNATGEFKVKIPWCGLLIDTFSMEVLVDYSRYKSCRIRDTIRIDSGPGWRETLWTAAVSQSFYMRLQVINLDEKINSNLTIAVNVFQAALVLLAKLSCCLSEISAVRGFPCQTFSHFFKHFANHSIGSFREKVVSMRGKAAAAKLQDSIRIWTREIDILTTLALRKTILSISSYKLRRSLDNYLSTVTDDLEGWKQCRRYQQFSQHIATYDHDLFFR